MTPPSMQVYARLCGWTLARAHARSGDRIAISAYLGTSNTVRHCSDRLRRDVRRPERTRSCRTRSRGGRWTSRGTVRRLTAGGLLPCAPSCSSATAVRDQVRSSSLKSLALSRIRRSVKKSPGSVRRRSLEIWSADSLIFVSDRPSIFVGNNESSCAVVITPADRPVGALIKVRTRRPAYRFAAAMPCSLEASTDFWAAWVIHSGGD